MRILIDATDTLNSGMMTGIQRVTENLSINLSKFGNYSIGIGIPNSPGKFRILSADQFEKIRKTSLKSRSISSWRSQLISWLFQQVTVIGILRKFRILKALRNLNRFFMKRNYQETEGQSASIGRYQVYFTSDAFWNHRLDLERILNAKKNNLKVCILVHDILPMQYPDLFRPDSRELFEKNFIKGISAADVIVTVSNFTKESLISFFDIPAENIHVVHLASFSREKVELRKPLLLGATKSFILMTGTIEPRKNYLMVLKVIESSFPEELVVVVGREGWMHKEELAQMSKMKNVIWLNNADDDELAWLMENAKIAICASLAEGFGLPLREFLERKVRVVAAEIPPFLELEPFYKSFVTYFNPYSPADFERALKTAISSKRKSHNLTKVKNWNDVAGGIDEVISKFLST